MPTALQPGDAVGDYEVLAPLGRGAFSRTYEARSRDGRLVVLKFPDPTLLGDPNVYDRFQREFAIGQRMSYPGIPRTLEIGDSDSGPYLVLEFVEGTSFRDYLHGHAPLPLDLAIDLTLQVARALDYAHGEGIFHRDLKPENLVISPDMTMHIVDFGIALLEGARRLTWRFLSDAMGTPDYMAPEQVQGKRGDARTDIYALGIMFYEMVTGRVPFQGDNMLALMNQHLNASVPPPRSLNRAVPAALEGIILKMLRKDPDERYQSAADLVDDLRRYPDLDPALFVFGEEKPARVPYSDKTIWLLGIGIGVGFFVLVVLLVLIAVVINH